MIEEVREVDRPDAQAADRRNDRRFSYKKRFTQAFHERLQNLDEDKYLQDVVGELARHWAEGNSRV